MLRYDAPIKYQFHEMLITDGYVVEIPNNAININIHYNDGYMLTYLAPYSDPNETF